MYSYSLLCTCLTCNQWTVLSCRIQWYSQKCWARCLMWFKSAARHTPLQLYFSLLAFLGREIQFWSKGFFLRVRPKTVNILVLEIIRNFKRKIKIFRCNIFLSLICYIIPDQLVYFSHIKILITKITVITKLWLF